MRDARKGYRPHKTLYNRGSDKGIVAKMMAERAAGRGEKKSVMTNATYLKSHRTASSLSMERGAVA